MDLKKQVTSDNMVILVLLASLIVALVVIVSGETCKECECDTALVTRLEAEVERLGNMVNIDDSWECVEYNEFGNCLRGKLK